MLYVLIYLFSRSMSTDQSKCPVTFDELIKIFHQLAIYIAKQDFKKNFGFQDESYYNVIPSSHQARVFRGLNARPVFYLSLPTPSTPLFRSSLPPSSRAE